MAKLGTHCPYCKFAYPHDYIAEKQEVHASKLRMAYTRRKEKGLHCGPKVRFPRAKIREMANQGLNQAEISRVLNCSKATVSNALRSY